MGWDRALGYKEQTRTVRVSGRHRRWRCWGVHALVERDKDVCGGEDVPRPTPLLVLRPSIDQSLASGAQHAERLRDEEAAAIGGRNMMKHGDAEGRIKDADAIW